ncbi:MAG: bdbD [Myxococcales bacterium]|nr:bdbD [Myxococcales bacterium]
MWLKMPIDPQRDHIRGPSNAPLQLVEYGDFQCPYCGRAYYEVQEVERRLRGQLQYVFRHFPLSEIHPLAVPAAETSEAAAAQGRFWEMYSMLYENQEALERPYLLRYARALGLDIAAVDAALDNHLYLPRIREDFNSGVRSGVNGTPCFFINGRRHDGAWDADSLLKTLERARQQQQPTQRATPRHL